MTDAINEVPGLSRTETAIMHKAYTQADEDYKQQRAVALSKINVAVEALKEAQRWTEQASVTSARTVTLGAALGMTVKPYKPTTSYTLMMGGQRIANANV